MKITDHSAFSPAPATAARYVDSSVIRTRAGSAVQSLTTEQAKELINRAVRSLTRNLDFSVDQSTGMTVIRVIDNETNEVVRQMPSEEALTIARTLDRMQTHLIDKQA